MLHFKKFCRFVLIPCFVITCNGVSLGQTDSLFQKSFIVHNVIISGNNKTKTQIISREIPLKKGDTIPASQLPAVLLKAKENVYNTKLFLSVVAIPLIRNDSTLDIHVIVKERWYTFPLPYVELADRSFNVWWHTYHADLRRLSYGVYVIQENLSGRNDELDVKATMGFNKQLDIEYTTPYTNEEMTERMRIKTGVLFSNEIPYITSDSNKLRYFQSTAPVRKEWFFSIGYLTRKYIKKREWLTLSVQGVNLSDSIRQYNPAFFSGGKTHVIFPELSYKFRYVDVDNVMYPLKGKIFETILSKRGLGWSGGVNRLLLEGSASTYLALGHQWYSILSMGGQIKLPFEQPYFNTMAFGYGQHYLRGYEYYVIDGVAFFLAKADLKKKILQFQVPTFFKSKNYSTIPFTLYAKIYSDAGSVYSRKESLLGNKFLWTGGVGLDIVTIYDIAVSINFSFNNLSEKGIFFHASR